MPAALRPAHIAPRPTPFIMGVTGRRPDGPRRSMYVTPAPIVIPISAAVSRSYSCSFPEPEAPSAPSDRAWTDTRGC